MDHVQVDGVSVLKYEFYDSSTFLSLTHMMRTLFSRFMELHASKRGQSSEFSARRDFNRKNVKDYEF